jgi:outer membrane lipoprotein-sorting protein
MRAPRSRLYAVLLCGLLPGSVAAQELAADELMRALAAAESSSATFVETKYSALLKTPYVTRGTLAYRRGVSLEKHVLSPYDERIVVQGDRVTIDNRSRGRKQSASTSSSPVLAALVEGIRATRSGDLAALERHFEVKVGGRREQWSMQLKPTGDETAKYVSSVVVSGAGGRITRVDVEEASGDRAVMEIREELK